MHIYADQISQITLSNGNVRVQLTQRGADNEEEREWGHYVASYIM